MKKYEREEFLALEGIFIDDGDFDEAIGELHEGWKKWEMQLSNLKHFQCVPNMQVIGPEELLRKER